MAANGIGASDIISATVGGATYGVTLLWALALGAFFKFVLTEGLARWQLATGTTLLEGWARYLPRWLLTVFVGYLVLWAIAVSGEPNVVIACTGDVPTRWRFSPPFPSFESRKQCLPVDVCIYLL